tara:strand:+ start:4693 stop:6126 length:1434 start_codon:yes stop_codon:yes gene_type:complete
LIVNNYLLVKQLIGLALLIDLANYTLYFNVYFGQGFEVKKWWNNKKILIIIYITWLLSSLFMIINVGGFLPILLLYIICRHYFVNGRWRSLFRGGGAPGLMSHFILFYLLLYELSFIIDKTFDLSSYVTMMLRVDFALIMLCAGVYKALSGYFDMNGMEYGMVNPAWSYWHKYLKLISSDNKLWHIQNLFASIGEIFIGISLLIPSLASLGASICIFSFLYLIPILRLGRLAFLMVIIPLLFLKDFGLYELSTSNFNFNDKLNYILLESFPVFAYGFCFLLPIIKIMQYYNLFLDRRFPKSLQLIFDRIALFYPIIIWRVFTKDVINFFIRISQIDKTTNIEYPIINENTTYNYCNWDNIKLKFRFLQVTESITIVTIFNFLKYYPSKKDIFKKRLLQYTSTLPINFKRNYRFTYISINKKNGVFTFSPTGYFDVDLINGKIVETIYGNNQKIINRSSKSPLRESIGFGSYKKRERI